MRYYKVQNPWMLQNFSAYNKTLFFNNAYVQSKINFKELKLPFLSS